MLLLSAALSIMVVVAGAASKIAKIIVSQDMLKAAIKSQEGRISRLEDAAILDKARKAEKPNLPKPPE